DEEAVIRRFIRCVRACDPDILVGYELRHCAWNYLAKRAQEAFGMPFCLMIGRVALSPSSSRVDRDMSRWRSSRSPELYVPGRHVLNAWKIMRSELSITDYTFESVVFDVLHIRIPRFENSVLLGWLNGTSLPHRWRVVSHFLSHATYTLALLEERRFARVFGVDFMSILTRGSQFKVESLLLRVAKLSNYVLLSPSRKEASRDTANGEVQVADQRALEYIPLVMEPHEGYYKDPTLVLDFRSLYPSLIIAHNICYSTCLGNLWRSELGVTPYHVPAGELAALQNKLHVAPNGAVFLDASARKSLFSQMLHELLATRAMVKESIRLYSAHETASLLEVRNLSLKFIANVMYGYMAASYSGRMPCVDLADAIVSYGRRLLEGTIRWINETEPSSTRVVYGDTDSIFVGVQGASIGNAFRVGDFIARSVTAMHPLPIKLKLEKVYLPCVLLSKKRYVGFSYESPESEPVYDAKGIETLHLLNARTLSMLFARQDLSEIRTYLQAQFTLFLQDSVPLGDLIIAKEVRMEHEQHGHLTPSIAVSMRRVRMDPQTRPHYAERVPYVIVYREQYANLTELAVSPEEYIQQGLRANAEYYIAKQIIPPLDRIFSLLDVGGWCRVACAGRIIHTGLDIGGWYRSMPRRIVYAGGLLTGHITRHEEQGMHVHDHCMLRSLLPSLTNHACLH
ncbi:hypothetical protein SYNPS1DRAFT_13724, partial [Syncephalis pseudoplumigaleata]